MMKGFSHWDLWNHMILVVLPRTSHLSFCVGFRSANVSNYIMLLNEHQNDLFHCVGTEKRSTWANYPRWHASMILKLTALLAMCVVWHRMWTDREWSWGSYIGCDLTGNDRDVPMWHSMWPDKDSPWCSSGCCVKSNQIKLRFIC